MQIHLAETEDEVSECVARTGKSPARYLDELGFLGPRTALAHCVWVEREDFELVAERGATVVTNPAANMKLAVGRAFPYPEAAAAGVALGLGTDGVSSNSNLDMFEEVKLFALLQKHASGDSSVLPAAEALAIARGLRSPLIGGHPTRGRRPGRLPPPAGERPRALGRRSRGRPRLRRLGLGRRHHRGRRAGADAGPGRPRCR